MKKNTARIYILIISLFACISLFALFSLIFPLIQEASKPIYTFKEKDINQILQVNGSATQHIMKDTASNWTVKMNNMNYPADTEKIADLIEGLLSISKQTVISKNKNKHVGLGIGMNKLVIKTHYGEHTLYVAENTNNNSVYLRMDNQDDIFTPSNDISSSTLLDDMRDLKVYLLKKEMYPDVITITQKGFVIDVVKQKNTWMIDQIPISQNKIDSYLQELTQLTAKHLLPSAESKSSTTIPDFSIDVTYGNNTTTAHFYKIDEELYEIKKSNTPYIFEIPAVYAASLQKEKKDFLD